MRHTSLVAYDVSAPERLRRVHQAVREYGDRLQLSVYRCTLSSKEVVLLTDRLTDLINNAHDRVLLVDLGPVGASTVELRTLGLACPEEEGGTIIL